MYLLNITCMYKYNVSRSTNTYGTIYLACSMMQRVCKIYAHPVFISNCTNLLWLSLKLMRECILINYDLVIREYVRYVSYIIAFHARACMRRYTHAPNLAGVTHQH